MGLNLHRSPPRPQVEEAADAAPELERDVRLDGLPEASRIFDLLYDSVIRALLITTWDV